ncbi:MAG: hypothetical protein J7J05_02285, partial [Thermococcus sp.]|uniref:hypothetical protein n=1 Tax=Thermococcus sp. TaxID=35749 RepID=UPI00260DCEDE
ILIEEASKTPPPIPKIMLSCSDNFITVHQNSKYMLKDLNLFDFSASVYCISYSSLPVKAIFKYFTHIK